MEESYDSVDTGIFAAAFGAFMFVYLIILVIIIAGMWKIFVKAGKPGWAAIIPIYNLIVLLEIVGKPVWWIILMLIPFVNFIILIILAHQLSLSFGQGAGITILLIILPFIGYPLLGFGSSQYVGPGGVAPSRPA